MRLVSYREDGTHRAAVESDHGLLDAGRLLGTDPLTLRELLAAGRLDELAGVVAEAPESAGVAGEPERLPPVPDPEKIVCIGLNYRAHAAEAGLEPPELPAIFAKYRNALAPSGSEVSLPAASRKVDYEAEVAFVVGRRCSEVDAARAAEAIAGYTLLNDLSARDLQFATPQWMPGKVFDGSAPCGPALVTPDEAGDHGEIEFELRLNGETMQRSSTADLVFSMPELLSRLSEWMTMEPGDIVSTGTPAGVGGAREPRVWLRPGDEIEISSPTLGRLTTRIA